MLVFTDFGRREKNTIDDTKYILYTKQEKIIIRELRVCVKLASKETKMEQLSIVG